MSMSTREPYVVDVKETRWWVSPFLTGGWCTRGVGSERALGTGGEECEETMDSREEKEHGSSGELWLLVKIVLGLEAEQPMN